MSSKRKNDDKALPAKRGRKKKTDDDFESDGSEEVNDNAAVEEANAKVEILIDDETQHPLPEVICLAKK